ncbi:MAG: hypothetical protein OHK0015_13870 [Chloroflexi bacterium OHK40]
MDLREAPPQSFCSFLAAFGPAIDEEAFERAAARLPHYRPTPTTLTLDGLRLCWYAPERNPLHRWVLHRAGQVLLLVQGDFYGPLDEGALAATIAGGQIDRQALTTALARLRGVFNGFVINQADHSCLAFVDRLGFTFLYHCATGPTTWLSSSLWPLLRLRPQAPLAPEAVEDMVLFGFPTGNRTILRDVFTIQPGRIVAMRAGHSSAVRYVPPIDRRLCRLDLALDEFRGAFGSHFDYVRSLIPVDRFVTTLTGGHDTRVILNAMLANAIVPTCLTGTDRGMTGDVRRSAQIARIAGAPLQIANYGEADPALHADAFFMSEGTGTGLWMARLSEVARLHGDVAYFGFSGDILSGSGTVTLGLLRGDDDADALVRKACLFNYEYRTDPETLCRTLFGHGFDTVLERYAATFAPYQGLDRYGMFVQQRIDDRNFRRIGGFAHAAQTALPAVHFFHDPRIAELYLSLDEGLLLGRKLHCRLCYDAIPAMAWVPGNPWHVPLWLEPAALHHVRAAGKFVQRLRRAPARAVASSPPDARLQAALAMHEGLDAVDLDALRALAAQEAGSPRAHLLALRVATLARLLRFARGQPIVEEQHARLFARREQGAVVAR